MDYIGQQLRKVVKNLNWYAVSRIAVFKSLATKFTIGYRTDAVYTAVMHRITKRFVFIILITSIGATGMALSDVGKVCLFSAISGVITQDGKPVANAKLVRKVNHSKDVIDETTTDQNGHFTMPAVFERTVTKLLPMEFVVRQAIYVKHEGKEYLLWEGVKREEKENSESRGQALIVRCELNQERLFKQVNGNPIVSFCTWDAEPDKINTGF